MCKERERERKLWLVLCVLVYNQIDYIHIHIYIYRERDIQRDNRDHGAVRLAAQAGAVQVCWLGYNQVAQS